MLRRTFAVAAAALFAATSIHCGVHAQNTAEGTVRQSNVTYLADLAPAAINERVPDKNYLSRYWKNGECTFQGHKYDRSISFGRDYGHCMTVFLTAGKYDYLEATVGIDDHYPHEQDKINVEIVGDDKQLYLSGKEADVGVGSKPVHIHIPIKDIGRLKLLIHGHGDFHAGDVWWGDARVIKGNSPAPKPPKPNPGDEDKGTEPTPPQAIGKRTLRIDPDKIKELASELKAKVAKDADLARAKPTLAIAAFQLIPADTLSSDNANNMREDLSTALIDTEAFEVVERGQLDKALEELKLAKKDIFDSSTAQKLGKQVGARVVMIGSISDRGEYAVVNVRLIDTATGKARIAGSVKLPQRDAPKKNMPDKSE